MLPQLQAEEALRLAQCIAVGTGSLKAFTRSQVLAEWERAAAGPEAARRTQTVADADTLKSAGIRVVKVKRKKRDAPQVQ